MFLYSELSNSLSICTCAKCGSTSLFMTLYAMISGSPYTRKTAPWVHDYMKWGFDNVSLSSEPGKLHLIMTRNPVERYISAFHSKLRCCDDGVTRCYQDLDNRFAPAFARLANMPKRECFVFEDYVQALENVHRLKKQHLLDAHFLPQDIACKAYTNTPTLVFDVNYASEFLQRLRGYKMHHYKMMHTHATPRNKGYNTSRLEALSLPEFEWVDRADGTF